MDKFALIGYPIAHSLSPKLFRAAYGGKYQYDLVEESDFEKAWKAFEDSYKAINVTAPFKLDAFSRCDHLSPECERVGATNLCVKTQDGIKGYNSDYLGVKAIVDSLKDVESVCVIGFGGAGKAALAAAQDCGKKTSLIRHDALSQGASADLVIYTLPRAAQGYTSLKCAHLLEANYRDPVLKSHEGYIPGTRWHLLQAVTGYKLMTGEEVDVKEMEKVYL